MDKDTYTEHEVKFFDLYLVKHSDLVLVNLEHPDSIGTAIEIHEAHDNWKIPVVGYSTLAIEIHPWMELSLTKKCKDMLDAINYIIEFY